MAPAMNWRMWEKPNLQQHIANLSTQGCHFIAPENGEMACGEFGEGRLAEVDIIIKKTVEICSVKALPRLGQLEPSLPLSDKHFIVTSGASREPIDPVRYITNHSSGKQGALLAEALLAQGARVNFITGIGGQKPNSPWQSQCQITETDTAKSMLNAVRSALPADGFIGAAAVADWHVASISSQKIKKKDASEYQLSLVNNQDILATIAALSKDKRPKIVIGFAAETENIIENATRKMRKKQCDMLFANDVSSSKGVFGGEYNSVSKITPQGVDSWPRMTKTAVAEKIVDEIALYFKNVDHESPS